MSKHAHARLNARLELVFTYRSAIVQVEQPKREPHPTRRIRQLKRPEDDDKLTKIYVSTFIRVDQRKQAIKKDVLL
jgi:hypothetical protein